MSVGVSFELTGQQVRIEEMTMVNRDRWKRFIGRWREDYGFKTMVTAFGSLLVTVIFALYNGFLGIYHSSLWYGTICVYYILLTALRGIVIASEKRIGLSGEKEKARNKIYLYSSVLLLVLNLSLFVPVTLMVKQQKPVMMTLIPAIAMAAYTTYKITMASVNMKKSRRSMDCLVRFLRRINFIDALVSILVLQNTLIMVNSKGNNAEMLPLTAVTSAVVLLAVLLLSVIAMADAAGRIRRRE